MYLLGLENNDIEFPQIPILPDLLLLDVLQYTQNFFERYEMVDFTTYTCVDISQTLC